MSFYTLTPPPYPHMNGLGSCQTLAEMAGNPTRVDSQGVRRPITCRQHLVQIARQQRGLTPCPSGLAGSLGQASDETPDVKTLPWNIGKVPVEESSERAWSRFDRVGSVVGVVGGLLGLVLAYRAVKSGRSG